MSRQLLFTGEAWDEPKRKRAEHEPWTMCRSEMEARPDLARYTPEWICRKLLGGSRYYSTSLPARRAATQKPKIYYDERGRAVRYY